MIELAKIQTMWPNKERVIMAGKKFVNDDFNDAIDEFIEQNWEECVQDISRLVQVPSFLDEGTAAPSAPFGLGPRAALDEILSISKSMGFEVMDVDGYIGFAEMPGETDTQLGIIGHVDVVPAGPGWHFEPYAVDIKDGYLVGRGTLDDKGPVVVALYAMKFWHDRGVKFPYTIRFLFGCNEETGMEDVAYYHTKYADPAFLFTPDAEFPVCYGEKGGFDGVIISAPFDGGAIKDFEGGIATNAVPGSAHAVVAFDIEDYSGTENIVLEPYGDSARGLVKITATGKSAHASMPEDGVNAIALIVNWLVDNNICTGAELDWLLFEQKLLNYTDGSGLGIATSDKYFGPLTIIGGTIKTEDGKFIQTLDSRFPTSITAEEILRALKAAAPADATVENTLLMEPFLVDPDTPAIQVLADAFNEVTGENRKPFTIGGGTYAREFKCAASFGPEMPWKKDPDWVGTMHGPDEGISIEQLKTALKIYALAIGKLNEIKL